jgi:hypothetical protein
MFRRSLARLMQPSTARAMKQDAPKRSAMAMPNVAQAGEGRMETMLGVMLGSVIFTGVFSFYGGMTLFGRLADRAGKAGKNVIHDAHNAQQQLLRHAGVYADKSPNNLPSGVNPSQRL